MTDKNHCALCCLFLSFALSGCLGDENYPSWDAGPDTDNGSGDGDGDGDTDGDADSDADGDSDSDADADSDSDADADSDSDADADTCNPSNEPTWTNPIDSMMTIKCARCHPMEVSSYAAFTPWIQSGEARLWINKNHYISGSDKDTSIHWLDIGAPETDCEVKVKK